MGWGLGQGKVGGRGMEMNFSKLECREDYSSCSASGPTGSESLSSGRLWWCSGSGAEGATWQINHRTRA